MAKQNQRGVMFKKEWLVLLSVMLLMVVGWVNFFTHRQRFKEREAGLLSYRVGIIADSAPFAFRQNDILTGFDVAVMEELARRAHFTVVWVDLSVGEVEEALGNKKVDMVIGGDLSATAVRRSTPYVTLTIPASTFVVRQKIARAEDLGGLHIAVISQGTMVRDLSHLCRWYRCRPQIQDDRNLMVEAFRKGSFDALMTQPILAQALVDEGENLSIFTVGGNESLHTLEGVIAFSQTFGALMEEKLNKEIAALRATSWMTDTKKYWLYPKIEEHTDEAII